MSAQRTVAAAGVQRSNAAPFALTHRARPATAAFACGQAICGAHCVLPSVARMHRTSKYGYRNTLC